LSGIELLVRGPEVSICSRCVEACVSALRRHRVRGFRAWWDPRPPLRGERPLPDGYRASTLACSFCLKPESDDLVAAEHARICAACVRLCVDMFTEQRARRR
jgi:ATP-dependent protease Clp ATPase subunit